MAALEYVRVRNILLERNIKPEVRAMEVLISYHTQLVNARLSTSHSYCFVFFVKCTHEKHVSPASHPPSTPIFFSCVVRRHFCF